MIEDNPFIIQQIIHNTNIHVFCYNTPYNQKIIHPNVTRIYSWYDVLEKLKGFW